MKREELIAVEVEKARAVIRRQHKALATEQAYCGWLRRYFTFVFTLPRDMKSEQKAEAFLTMLAKRDVSASTQGGVTPHNLRHSYATHSLERGVNMKALQEAMGHSNIATTSAYCHAEALSVPSPLEAIST